MKNYEAWQFEREQGFKQQSTQNNHPNKPNNDTIYDEWENM